MELASTRRETIINYVLVIESLTERERTGKDLFDDILARRALQHNYGCGYAYAASKMDFLQALQEVYFHVIHNGMIPLLHIEAHGNENGLKLADNSFISWNEIGYHLRNINVALKNNLILVLGACYGLHISSQIIPIFPAPFRVVVGPYEEVSKEAVQTGFEAFYEKFVNRECVDTLNEMIASLNEGFYPAFHFIDSEVMFESSWDFYCKELSTREAINDAVDFMVINGNLLPEVDPSILKETFARGFLGNQEGKGDLFNHFMMKSLGSP